jgi:hypothetical protein
MDVSALHAMRHLDHVELLLVDVGGGLDHARSRAGLQCHASALATQEFIVALLLLDAELCVVLRAVEPEVAEELESLATRVRTTAGHFARAVTRAAGHDPAAPPWPCARQTRE